MFIATILFSTKIGPSRETCLTALTLEGIHDKIERIKKILEKHKLIFVGSIVEEVPSLTIWPDALDQLKSPSGLDFLSQDGRMYH